MRECRGRVRVKGFRAGRAQRCPGAPSAVEFGDESKAGSALARQDWFFRVQCSLAEIVPAPSKGLHVQVAGISTGFFMEVSENVKASAGIVPNPMLKWLDQVREVLRLIHYSISTKRG